MSPKNWKIIGHEQQISFLKNAIISDTIFQSYLFVGPESVGKRLVATRFVQSALLSLPTGEFDENHISFKKIEHGNSEDLIVLDTEKISIEEIRKLKERISTKSSKKLFCIIDGYENINYEARHTLLKTLEEPNKHVCFIILAQNISGVLKTIISRCYVVRFSSSVSIQNEELPKVIQSLGRPGLVYNSKKIEEYVQHEEHLKKIVLFDLIDQMAYIEKLIKKDAFHEMLWVWVCVLRYQFHATIYKTEGFPWLEKYSRMNLSKMIINLSAAQSLLKKNVNKRLVLENVCLTFS